MTADKIHILILSSWYPTKEHPFLGNFVERQAVLLSQKYEVSVVHTESGDYSENKVIEKLSNGIREIRIQHPRGKHLLQRKKNQELALKQGFKQLEKVDLIIGHVLFQRGLQFISAKKHFSCPLIYVEHGSYFRDEKRNHWSWKEKLILKKVLPKVDDVIAVSSALKYDMEKVIHNRSIEIIGNHIDTDTFKPKEQKLSSRVEFLHVSTLDKATKNPRGIFEACAILRESTTDFNLTIVCDEDVSEWKQLCDELNISQFIEFIGPLDWEQLVPHYQKAEAFVLFSNYESFSIVLAEAWATGTPVISTSVGIAQNLSPDLGIQVQHNNVDDLADAMLSICKERNAFQSNHLLKESQKYSAPSILKKWDALIEKHVQ